MASSNVIGESALSILGKLGGVSIEEVEFERFRKSNMSGEKSVGEEGGKTTEGKMSGLLLKMKSFG